MDRRNFIKTSTIGAGFLMVNPSLAFAEQHSKTTLSTNLDIRGYVKEPRRDIPVIDAADVVILGGGPAGVAAAVSAARTGADVILLEKQYCLGGLWTGCCVLPVIDTHGCAEDGSWRKCIYGFAEELVRDLTDMDMCITFKGHPTPDPEATKYILEKYIAESGVRLLYNCYGATVTMSGDRIDSVILDCKSGRVAIKSKVFIDCSGDGDILEWCGEDFEHRKLNIGAMWRCGNAGKLDRNGAFPTPVENVKFFHLGGEKGQDGLNVYNLTRLQVKYRKMMWETAMEDRKRPGCQNLFLLDTPIQPGVRVTRVLNAVHNVAFEDSFNYVSYNDCIGLSGGDSSIKYKHGTVHGSKRPIWQIPYRSLTPKRVSNLLVAGRCFGFDEGMTYDAREIGTCLVTGQAAGTAAALAALNRTSVRDVEIKKLQNKLIEFGVRL